MGNCWDVLRSMMVWGANLGALAALRSVQLSLQSSGKATSRSGYWQQGKGRSCVEEKHFNGPGYDVKDSFRTGKCVTPKPPPPRCPRMVYAASQQRLGPSYFSSALPDLQQPFWSQGEPCPQPSAPGLSAWRPAQPNRWLNQSSSVLCCK